MKFPTRLLGALLVLVVGLANTREAHADKEPVAWYHGERGHKRILHMGITVATSLAWLGSQKLHLDSPTCRWCDPPVFDRVVRDSLVWKNTDRASLYSSIDVFIVAPVVGITLLAIADHDASFGRLIDDVLPVAETVAFAQLFTQMVKFTVGRRRPYAWADPAFPYKTEDNLSFTSGHASIGFAITASAGIICHWRHYWTEPYVWGSGIALSLTAEYLRMAADKHWLSDVVSGGLIGLSAGLVIPRLLRQDIKIAPIPGGAAVVGMF